MDKPDFAKDVMKRSARRNMRWYQQYLVGTLLTAKEKRVKDIDQCIALARILEDKLNEKLEQPVEVPVREVIPLDDDSLMKPIDPKVSDLLYKSDVKGAAERYLKERNKLGPEDKFFFRVVTSWDYGWGQKESKLLTRDVNRGRCAILRDTFYRKKNVAPDPPHYASPAGGETSICSEYACIGN